MKRKIVVTADGSSSIYLPEWNEHYHSKHGAVQEAYHVFIRSGLDLFKDGSTVNILEIGLGTGLNAFITFLEARKRSLQIVYDGVEAFPVETDVVQQLNYDRILDAENDRQYFDKIHEIPWKIPHDISGNFQLTKRKQHFETLDDKERFDLVYFDAFGAQVQPELWSVIIFKKMYEALKTNGILVTYSAKGSVRRAMQEVGFKVERLPGPPGKREMLRAVKTEKHG